MVTGNINMLFGFNKVRLQGNREKQQVTDINIYKYSIRKIKFVFKYYKNFINKRMFLKLFLKILKRKPLIEKLEKYRRKK